MRVTYGYTVTDANDPYISLSEDAFKSLVFSSTGNYMVETFPFLRHLPAWLPGMEFKRLAQELREFPMRMANKPFGWTYSQIVGLFCASVKPICSLKCVLIEDRESGSIAALSTSGGE
jgi:hypothetical protein